MKKRLVSVPLVTAWLAASIFFAAALPTDKSFGGKGGKGKGGGGDPPPPPPVLYELTWLGTLGGTDSRARGMNNSGVVVGTADDETGSARAFVYTAELGMVDLNDPVLIGAIWTDEAGIPLEDQQDWTAESAADVNEQGQIVGRARNNSTDEGRAFFFDPVTAQLYLLPTVGFGDHSGKGVNEFGDIVADRSDPSFEVILRAVVYRWDGVAFSGLDLGIPSGGNTGISNPQVVDGAVQVVNRAGHRITIWPDSTVDAEFFPGLGLFDVNDSGSFAGTKWRVYAAKGRKVIESQAAYRSPASSTPAAPSIQILTELGAPFGMNINSSGDVCVNAGGRGHLFTDETGLLALDDLVVNQDDGWVDGGSVHLYGITDRDSTGFGAVCGGVGIAITRAFQLTPLEP